MMTVLSNRQYIRQHRAAEAEDVTETPGTGAYTGIGGGWSDFHPLPSLPFHAPLLSFHLPPLP